MLTFPEFCIIVRTAVREFTQYWLNPRQENAVSADPFPPIYIIAGPGTGKTTVLALRVLKFILVDGLQPESILATTFTRKAASELRSRILSWGIATIQEAIKDAQSRQDNQRLAWLRSIDINNVHTGTLDSLAEEIISDNRQQGQITPTVVEGFVGKGLLRRNVLFANRSHTNRDLELLLQSFNPDFPGVRSFSQKLRVCHSFADRVLHDRIDLNSYGRAGQAYQELTNIVKDYHVYLRSRYLIDFAMLEHEFLSRLQSGSLSRFTNELKAVLVDEFQDTNYLQEQIYYELCRQAGVSLTVVGDDDQSIYRFRGATVEIFASYASRITSNLGSQWCPNRYDLVENYRSTERIVEFFNYFINMESDFISARAPNKLDCVPASPSSRDPDKNIPVLGLFRHDVQTLAKDMSTLLLDVFRGSGRVVCCDGGISFTIKAGINGNIGDSVLLSWKVNEHSSGGNERLPLLIRRELGTYGVSVFNPRGRSLRDLPEIRICLGLMLECIDPGSAIQNTIRTMSRDAMNYINEWRSEARRFAGTNPAPGGIRQFIGDWASRRPRNMGTWPREWPILELLFTVVTWFPSLQNDPEGQVYLEAIARTIAEAGQISPYNSNIFLTHPHSENSIKHAIREIFEPIADDSIEVNEEIMPYVPRSVLPIMTIHQAKGLEFPLVIVDIGSDFKTNHHSQRKFRYPHDGSNVHYTEDHIQSYSPIGPDRVIRTRRQRAFDDIRRLYYVANSRAQNVLILAGLTSQLRSNRAVQSIATGDLINNQRSFGFIPSVSWTPNHLANIIALI